MADYSKVFAEFRSHADAEKARSMSAYMRDLFPFLGIPKPERARLQREFLKASRKESEVDWSFIDACWRQEREFQYLALDYLRAMTPLLCPGDIQRLRALALDRPWWDTVDALDMIIGDIALKYPEVDEVLLAWSTDESIWLRRIAIDHQLGRKEKTDTKLLEQIIVNNLGEREFLINKAIGWSLREYSKTDPAWVRGFIDTHGEQMAALSVREASKYL